MVESARSEDFPLHTYDKLRYGDTDRQGHINNAVFATFFETGRVHLLFDKMAEFREPDGGFVVARVSIDYIREVLWPGNVDIATRVASVGRSSVKIEHALFQDGNHMASAESVIVHIDKNTRRSRPLSAAAVEFLLSFGRPAADAEAGGVAEDN